MSWYKQNSKHCSKKLVFGRNQTSLIISRNVRADENLKSCSEFLYIVSLTVSLISKIFKVSFVKERSLEFPMGV